MFFWAFTKNVFIRGSIDKFTLPFMFFSFERLEGLVIPLKLSLNLSNSAFYEIFRKFYTSISALS